MSQCRMSAGTFSTTFTLVVSLMLLVFRTELERRIFEAIEGSLSQAGYEVIRIVASKNKALSIQIMIDQKVGVTVEDCAKASKLVLKVLDGVTFVPEDVKLEMSSPGVDRPLTRRKDFLENIGKKVSLVSESMIQGRKRFCGVLKDVEKHSLTIALKEGDYTIPFDELSKAQLDYFGNETVN